MITMEALTATPSTSFFLSTSLLKSKSETLELNLKGGGRGTRRGMATTVNAGNRGNNRKPLQKGRNLSIEAIQTVQALKRVHSKNDSVSLYRVFHSKFRRLLKFDMMAVLRELLRQNQCLLAVKVFEDIRKEQWYKPQVLLYVDMIIVMAGNGFLEKVELLCSYLKTESNLEPETEGFNALLRTLLSFNLTKLMMECYDLMKAVGCEPDRSTLRILINGLESKGESDASAMLRQDAQEYYGESLEFLEEDEMTVR